jgi:DNA-binding NarL/FixJ family response regulator
MLEKMIQTRLPFVAVTCTGRLEDIDSLLETSSFDVAILDIYTFPRNGIQYISAIKHRLPQGQVVVLTTHDSAEHKAAALKKGADCFISKNHATGKHLVDFIQAALL